jgi:hypothetical protein
MCGPKISYTDYVDQNIRLQTSHRILFVVQKINTAKAQAVRNKQSLTNLFVSYLGSETFVCMVLHTLSDDFFLGWTILNSLIITSMPPVGILCNITEN